MENKKYVIWNNKGGVGKTFLTYCLATQYALAHSQEIVVVIDMCPQANISEMILGGNEKGENNLEKIINADTTIASYIKERALKSQREKLGTETNYFLSAKKYNANMPDNLYLLAGDTDLDLCSKLIDHMASTPIRGAYKTSRELLVDLITSFEKIHTKQVTFFIDTNPSFASYTELAILASNRIIIPCTADSASIKGVKNLVSIIYGIDTNIFPNNLITFNQQAELNTFTLPKIHAIIQNKSRTNTASASKAYQAHIIELLNLVTRMEKTNAEIFTNANQRVFNIKDGNTLSTIINYNGLTLEDLRHQKYAVYQEDTQANQTQIDALKEDINTFMQSI